MEGVRDFIFEDGFLFALFYLFVLITPCYVVFNVVYFFIKVKFSKKSVLNGLVALVWPTPFIFISKYFLDQNKGEDKGLGGLADFFAGLFFICVYIAALAISTSILRTKVLIRIQNGKST